MDERTNTTPTRRVAIWISDPVDAPLYGCTFGQAVGRFFRRYAGFSGRSSRSEYWKVNPLIGGILLFGQLAATGGFEEAHTVTKVIIVSALVLGVVTFVPSLALLVRRLHDVNFSGGWAVLVFAPSLILAAIPFLDVDVGFFTVLLGLVSVVGGLFVLILLLLDSNPVGARFDNAIQRWVRPGP
ncbi:DUF805 domain-containing protein [Microlunatus speluncae]|uniref:DUF805 domain-containing protein n=1 Tax=Microlunatus speluncae TaxID=2594267 RepID=UPI00126678F8|nr:DUF805 domain-containing protein [Microlunatus speluncae]